MTDLSTARLLRGNLVMTAVAMCGVCQESVTLRAPAARPLSLENAKNALRDDGWTVSGSFRSGFRVRCPRHRKPV